MDMFTFNLPTGPCQILYHTEPYVPQLPETGGMYVADSNTVELLRKSKNFNPHAPLVVLDAGEEHKNPDSISTILSCALSAGLARDSLFIGFGGGVITDMTAFAASLYMRGTRVELVPTTLLAMSDASIGGKTGIDFQDTKNCIGTFYPAQKIHISIGYLSTLSDQEFRSGLAETLKTALLYAPKLFQILTEKKEPIMSRDPALLLEIVKRCVQAKAHVVERDLHESGERMFLNLGHTFGHALESLAGFGTVAHGDAVAWGIARALTLGKRLGITDPSYIDEVFSVLELYGWETGPVHSVCRNQSSLTNLGAEEIALQLLGHMKRDKKKRSGEIRFVLQREINSTLVMTVPDADVLAVLQ